MIRFVVAPDGAAVPEPQGGRLPGRGIWITATRQALRRTRSPARLFAPQLQAVTSALRPTWSRPPERLQIAQAALDALAILPTKGGQGWRSALPRVDVAPRPRGGWRPSSMRPTPHTGWPREKALRRAAASRREGNAGPGFAVHRCLLPRHNWIWHWGGPNVCTLQPCLPVSESETFLARIGAPLDCFRAAPKSGASSAGRLRAQARVSAGSGKQTRAAGGGLAAGGGVRPGTAVRRHRGWPRVHPAFLLGDEAGARRGRGRSGDLHRRRAQRARDGRAGRLGAVAARNAPTWRPTRGRLRDRLRLAGSTTSTAS